jgi:Ca-activated chloride channel family protein
MNWIQEPWLGALAIVALLAVIGAVATALHRRAVGMAFGEELALQVLPRGTRRRRVVRDLLMLLGLALLVVALAEPAFDKEIVQVKTEGVDLVLALDLSRSMDADDVDPSRMERARREVEDLLEILVGDRVAVIFFAGEAIGRLPLTEDYKAVSWVLGEADTLMFKAQGSAVGKAIDVAREMLARDEGKAGKALVVFSDGETHDPEDALRAAREAADEGLVVYTVAIGDATSTIPDRQGGLLMHDGAQVKTTPDFSTLEEVARITGGATVKSVPSASDMERLYRNEIRSTVRAAQRETQQAENWRSAYQAPLAAGLLCWLAGAWLGDGRRVFGAATAVLLTVSFAGAPGVAHADPTLPEADALYQGGDFRRAEKAFEELSLQSPDNADLLERLGAARYRQGDFVGAASAYERASHLRGGDADALYNAGNARYRAGQLESALKRYDEAVAIEPDHEGASANERVVSSELAARRQQQPPPPPQPQDGGGEDDKEGGSGEEEPQDPTEGDSGGDEENEGEGEGDQSDQSQDSNDGSADSGEGSQQQEQGEGQQGGDQSGEQQPSDEGVDPDQLDGDQGEDAQDGDQQTPQGDGTGDSGMGEASGTITPAQAGKMLDGVEEGRQRVQYVGREGAKPW